MSSPVPSTAHYRLFWNLQSYITVGSRVETIIAFDYWFWLNPMKPGFGNWYKRSAFMPATTHNVWGVFVKNMV